MQKFPLKPAALLALLTMLAGCASTTQEIAPGTPTRSSNAACLSIEPISPNRGKPGGATTEDVATALDRDNPIGRVRNLVGDTDSTLRSVDKNNAALKALCGGVGSVGR